MEKALTVAKALYNMYKDMFGKSMDEMKMHKIMYFTQRESVIVNREFLFNEDFQGWKYGPVLLEIRQQYSKALPFSSIMENVSPKSRDLLKSVLRFTYCWRTTLLLISFRAWDKIRCQLELTN